MSENETTIPEQGNAYTEDDLQAMTKPQIKERLEIDFKENIGDTGIRKDDLVQMYLRAQRGEDMRPEKRVRVTLHSDGTPTGNQAQFVAVNGYAYQIPRDTPVDVPEEVVEALQNAKMGFLEQVSGSGADGELNYQEREVGRFALTVER